MVIQKLKTHINSIDQMLAEFIEQGVEEFAHIHELINSVCNKEDLPEE
jgi:predicted transcriptional regulator